MEIGGPRGLGATVNVGLPSGAADADYLAVFDHVFVPALLRFKPDLVLISAGFDAFIHDPLAGMRVTHAGYAAMAQRLRSLADRTSGGRIVAVLEGGYDLDGLGGGMTQTVAALTAAAAPPPPLAPLPEVGPVRAAIDATLDAHRAAGVAIPAPETSG
jgi:acetoin utilization deacetylase AcuC-like enzyme